MKRCRRIACAKTITRLHDHSHDMKFGSTAMPVIGDGQARGRLYYRLHDLEDTLVCVQASVYCPGRCRSGSLTRLGWMVQTPGKPLIKRRVGLLAWMQGYTDPKQFRRRSVTMSLSA